MQIVLTDKMAKVLSAFRSSQANCMLEDAPVKSEMYNMSISELPGQVYSGDQQCKHLYGSEASVCKFELPNVSARMLKLHPEVISDLLQ